MLHKAYNRKFLILKCDFQLKYLKGDFNIYRIVEVLWVIDWNHPSGSAKADEVFGYRVRLQGGNVMLLETMPTFQQHWQNQGGLTVFQEHVRTMLNLPGKNDNG